MLHLCVFISTFNSVPHFPVLHFPPLHYWSCIFRSCILTSVVLFWSFIFWSCVFSQPKISPVPKKFTRVWRHFKQLLVHRLATWLLHFVPTSYSGKVTKGQRPMKIFIHHTMLNRNFLLIQKLSCGFFYPKRNTRVKTVLLASECSCLRSTYTSPLTRSSNWQLTSW